MIQAYRYRGFTYLKFGKKNSPGVMYDPDDVQNRCRPAVELWRDGTVTFEGRPEGDITMMKKVKLPAWAYQPIKRFKARS